MFLSTDDTIVVKFGKHFEQVSILHDHALHTGKLYVNGHAFVSLMLCVPIMKQHHDKSYISYVAVPLGYRIWTKAANKLKMATDMVSVVMPLMKDRQVILSFDSWYAKRTFIQPLQGFENLTMICNARCDSALLICRRHLLASADVRQSEVRNCLSMTLTWTMNMMVSRLDTAGC